MTAELPRTSTGVATGYCGYPWNSAYFHGKCHGSWHFHGKGHGCVHGTSSGSVRGKLCGTNHGNPQKSAPIATEVSAEESFYGSPPDVSLTKSPVSQPAPGRIS